MPRKSANSLKVTHGPNFENDLYGHVGLATQRKKFKAREENLFKRPTIFDFSENLKFKQKWDEKKKQPSFFCVAQNALPATPCLENEQNSLKVTHEPNFETDLYGHAGLATQRKKFKAKEANLFKRQSFSIIVKI